MKANKTNKNYKMNKSRKSQAGARSKQEFKQAQVQKVPVSFGRVTSSEISPSILIKSRELCCTLSTEANPNFQLLGNSANFPGYDINPSCVLLFPWMSQIARAFEKYRFEKLSFELVARNSTVAAGVVYMGIDYDWDDVPATTATELMANRGTVSSNVWQSLRFDVDIRRLNMDVPYRYVADVPRSNNSQRMVYGGFLMIATAGLNSNCTFDLFAEYHTKFDLPALHHIDEARGVDFDSHYFLDTNVPTPSPCPTIPGLSTSVSGVSGCPTFVSTVLNCPSGTAAYQVPSTQNGSLSYSAELATTLQKPSLYATLTQGGFRAFNNRGIDLGEVPDEAFLSRNSSQGPLKPYDWETVGALGAISATLNFAALRAVMPLAAYLVPFFTSASSRYLNTPSNLKVRYSEL